MNRDREPWPLICGHFEQRFTEAMDDDFNTPIAIAVLFELSKSVNAALDRPEGMSETSMREPQAFLDKAGREILGILTGRQPDR